MAKKASKTNGKSLVIVESPAKARTIGRYLGKGYTVEASIGHIRDLPQGAREIPEKFKGEEWAYLGVNVNESFTPIYIVPPSKKQQVAKLKDALAELPERVRFVFLLHRYEGMKYREIAQHLGISVSSVEKYMMQAIKHVAKRPSRR